MDTVESKNDAINNTNDLAKMKSQNNNGNFSLDIKNLKSQSSTILQNSNIGSLFINPQPSSHYVALKVDEKSIEKYDINEINKGGRKNIITALIFLITAMSTFLTNSANLCTIMSYLNVHINTENMDNLKPLIYFGFLLLGLIFINKNSLNLYSAAKKLKDGQFEKFKPFYRKPFYSFITKTNDSYTTFNATAACNYPFCQGDIVVIEPPPKEKANHHIIGICSIGGIQHTYRIDNNLVAYQQLFDWGVPVQTRN